MAKISKKKKLWKEKIDLDKNYPSEEAFKLVKEFANRKFKESVDVSIKLGVDPKKSDQVIRGSCSLPNGTGKVERVLVFAKNEKATEAKEAGADYVGGADLSDKIKEGWTDFDRVIATPDMMGEVGKIGKILGPKGLMPNPKVGTVTFNVAETVDQIKKGQVEFRTDKGGNVHALLGKSDFAVEKLNENLKALVERIIKLKPANAKGVYLRNIHVSSTMGPGISVDVSVFN